MGKVLIKSAIITRHSIVTLPICSLNIKSFVANTPKSLTVSFISISFPDDVLYGSIVTSFSGPCVICSNFFSLNFILFFSAHLYTASRSFCMSSSSSFVFIFLFTLVSSAKHLIMLSLTSSSISDIMITKSMAAKTVPCGTPDITSSSLDILPFATTLNFRPLRNSIIYLTPSHTISHHLKTSHNISQHLTTSHNISQHLTTFHNISQYLTTSQNISQHITTSHNISQHITTSHNISQHLTTSHNISLHLTTSYNISQYLTISHIISQHLKTSYNISQHITTPSQHLTTYHNISQ